MSDETNARVVEVPLASVLSVATPVVSAIVFIVFVATATHAYCTGPGPMTAAERSIFLWGPVAVTLAVAVASRQPARALVRQVARCVAVSGVMLVVAVIAAFAIGGGSCGG